MKVKNFLPKYFSQRKKGRDVEGGKRTKTKKQLPCCITFILTQFQRYANLPSPRFILSITILLFVLHLAQFYFNIGLKDNK